MLSRVRRHGPDTVTGGEHTQVVVIGGGQAGLAAGYHLRRLGVDFVMCEARDAGLLKASPMFVRLDRDGVVWAEGTRAPADAVTWCTGFRPALSHLARIAAATVQAPLDPPTGQRFTSGPRPNRCSSRCDTWTAE